MLPGTSWNQGEEKTVRHPQEGSPRAGSESTCGLATFPVLEKSPWYAVHSRPREKVGPSRCPHGLLRGQAGACAAVSTGPPARAGMLLSRIVFGDTPPPWKDGNESPRNWTAIGSFDMGSDTYGFVSFIYAPSLPHAEV